MGEKQRVAVFSGRMCGSIEKGPLVHASAQRQALIDWAKVTCEACLKHRPVPTPKAPAVRTVVVKIAVETDAGEVDLAQAAEQFGARLRKNGAQTGRTCLGLDYPTEEGATNLWEEIDRAGAKETR